MGAPSAKFLGNPVIPLSPLSVFSWSNTSNPQSRRIPLPCTVSLALHCWQGWCGAGCGGSTGLLPGGMEQHGAARVSWIHPVLQLSAARECLDQPLPGAAEPQPGLFLADLFIWVLHCCRPRLSFCCTCARVHNPGSSRHRGGVSFYAQSPPGIDNCFTEHHGERMERLEGSQHRVGNVPCEQEEKAGLTVRE